MSLQLFQIYYADHQLNSCYDFAIPYFNSSLSDFFENSVIADLVPRAHADYIGVCSWRLAEKRNAGYCPIVLKGDISLSREKLAEAIERHQPDVINLRPFREGHKMLFNAAQWHGGEQHNFAWENAIEELKTLITIPNEVNNPIYENAFIARRELYVSYVHDCLIPVMEFMRGKPVFFVDSGYAPKKERTSPESVKEYRQKTGRLDWPIAPFILERLLSIYINYKQLKIINL